MSDILDKARQVVAEYYDSMNCKIAANGIRTDPGGSVVCELLDRFHAANLLAREPRELTEDEKQAMARKLVARSTGDPTRTSSIIADCLDYGDWLLSQSYPDYAAMEKELAGAKAKIAELEESVAIAEQQARDNAKGRDNALEALRLDEAPLRKEIADWDKKYTNLIEAMGCPPDDDPIHWGKVLHRTLHAANELRCENKQQAEEIERLKADHQSTQSLYETASRKSKQLFGNVIAERDQLRIDNEQLRGELSNAYKVSEDRNRLRLLLAEAHGWIKSYRLGEGDSLQERIEDSIGIGQAVHRTSVPTGRSTEAKPLLADAILCFEDWKELSAQRQWELFQRKRKEEIRLRTIVAWCAWNTDWADQLQSSTQWSTEDDLVKAMCKAIACHLHNGSSKGDIK